LDWPGNSPDLNPIENLWHILKVKITEEKPKTLKELDRNLKNLCYNGIPPGIIQNLVDSMPTRIKSVIKNNGGPTKY